MSVTLIATMKIEDKEMLGQYREKAGSALAKHGGSVIAAGPISRTLEGAQLGADTAAILSFPDIESSDNWINDPELQPIHAMRNKAGKSTVTLIG